MNKQNFTYCIGYPYHDTQIDSSLCVYTYGKETQYGTITNAKNFKKYVESKHPENKWFIYKLDKINENE